MNKLTKIIATIGPATDSPEMIEALINAGVNIFRFNFKHNTVEWHNERIERVNAVAKKMGVNVGTLIDLQGPEIRINMPGDQIEIKKNEKLIFGEEAFTGKPGAKKGFSISHPDIIPHIKNGQHIVADDGAFRFTFERIGSKSYLIPHNGGIMKQRKSLNIPGADFPFPVLVDRDFDGLELAAKNEIDFVALSFVRTASDLQVVRREMNKYKVKGMLVAKIETQKAIDHLDDIVKHADALMVARGDLGVELPIEQVPYYQKLLIKKCIEHNIPVITATQMLQSMVDSPFPTRAEISDVGNATYDFTDAVMLSGETATGSYPLQTVEIMAKTAAFNESKFLDDIRLRFNYSMNKQEEIIADAAYNVYLKSGMSEKVQAFIVFTQSGKTARLVSRYRPQVPVFVFTPSSNVADSLSISFGAYPFVVNSPEKKGSLVDTNELLRAVELLKKKKMLEPGKKVIILHGDKWAVEGGTSTIKIVQL